MSHIFMDNEWVPVQTVADELVRLRRVVRLVTELTHDTDGADLHPDSGVPVGEVMRALAGEPL